jgi:acetolactate synthase I/II/III large subunit
VRPVGHTIAVQWAERPLASCNISISLRGLAEPKRSCAKPRESLRGRLFAMKAVDAIAAAIRAEGITVAFNVPDEVTVLVAHALQNAKIRVVRPRHEQNAVAMADGYARASGDVGLCVVGPGPALAQTGTGLVTAARCRSQVLVLLGEIPNTRGAVKSFDARRYAEATEAHYHEVRNTRTLASDIREAFRLVRLRRGPVILAIGDQFQLSEPLTGDLDYHPTTSDTSEPIVGSVESSALQEAAAMLANANRPLIVAGRGAVYADAAKELEELADRTGAILASSLQAREYFHGHPRYVGTVGSFAADEPLKLLMTVDCILAAGISLNPYQVLPSAARLIHVDCDAGQIGAYQRPELGIIGDVRAVASGITRCIDALELQPSSFWTSAPGQAVVQAAISAPTTPKPIPQFVGGAGARLPIRLALALAENALPPDRIVIADAGLFLGFLYDGLSVPDAKSWLWTMDFGSIGLGLAMAIGAAIANPGRYCVLVVGDGGFMMSIQELETAVRERVPLCIMVMNDAAYAAEVHVLKQHQKSLELAQHDDISFAEVAVAFGATAQTVRSPDDINLIFENLPEPQGPFLVDLKISQEEHHRMLDAVAMMNAVT